MTPLGELMHRVLWGGCSLVSSSFQQWWDFGKSSCFLWPVLKKVWEETIPVWHKATTVCSLPLTCNQPLSWHINGSKITWCITWPEGWGQLCTESDVTINRSTPVEQVLTVTAHVEWLASSGNTPLSCFVRNGTIKEDDIANWLLKDKDQRRRGVGESPNEKHTLQLHD